MFLPIQREARKLGKRCYVMGDGKAYGTEDLEHLPKNGWAYHGIKSAYEALNDKENAAHYDALYKKSWAHADFEL